MYVLKGQTALVTGAAQGIGLGIALELAWAGSRIVIADMNLQKAEAAAEEVQRAGGESLPVAFD